MKSLITEDHVEEATLQILREDLGYEYIYGPDIGPDGKTPQRKSYQEVVLVERLRNDIEAGLGSVKELLNVDRFLGG